MSEEAAIYQPSCADSIDKNALQVPDAIARIKKSISIINETEKVTIDLALGRILASDFHSTINVPNHTNSAVDGYAISSSDLNHDAATQLSITGNTVFAGLPYTGKIKPGQCVRIMTGAKMPEGTDTVIMQEHVAVNENAIQFKAGYKPGQNVRQAGEDLSIGQVAIPAGKKLTPAELGMLASMGVSDINVRRKLKVAFFSTGNEIRSLGETLHEGEIYDSNRYTLHGMLSRLQADIIDLGIIADDPRQLREALDTAASQADVIITTGGVSVGDADYIKDVIAELGQINFWKLAIKPGRPFAFGKIKDSLFFGLPGNPVAVMVTFYQFVQPALKTMMGQTDIHSFRFKVPCSTRLKKKPGRTEYYRGILDYDNDGKMIVRKAGMQGSGILSSMSKANCFIVLQPERNMVEPGQLVDIEPFEGLL